MEQYGPNDANGNPQRNPIFPDFSEAGGNCANFVSQALNAGGIPMNSGVWYVSSRIETSFWRPTWGFNVAAGILRIFGRNVYFNDLALNNHAVGISSTWNNAHEQFSFFSNPTNGFIYGEVIQITRNTDIEEILTRYNIQTGDLLHWRHDDSERIHHATIVSMVTESDILFAGNTSNDFDRSLVERIRRAMENNEALYFSSLGLMMKHLVIVQEQDDEKD